MKNIESIILYCENCESIEIEGRYIGEIELIGLKQIITRYGEYRICEDFILEINRDADKKYKSFGMISDEILFERLINIRDIVSITIRYNDGSLEDNMYMPYREEENNYQTNRYQHVYKSNLNHLYIVCSKEKEISDYFDMEYINDEKAMNIYWKMLESKKNIKGDEGYE